MTASFSDIPGTFLVPFTAPSVAAASSSMSQLIFAAPYDAKIVKVVVMVDTGITGADTNYFTWKLYNRGTDGAGTTLLAQKAFTNGVNLAAKTPLELYAPSTPLDVEQGTILDLYWEKAGTGLAQPRVFGYVVIQGGD